MEKLEPKANIALLVAGLRRDVQQLISEGKETIFIFFNSLTEVKIWNGLAKEPIFKKFLIKQIFSAKHVECRLH